MGFFKNMFQSLGNFFQDPLNLNSRDREEEHFAQQQSNWEKEFALQKDQFEYQKWFDQNNVTLNLKQNMDAGINPLAAQGAGSSSVSSSASPQQPSQSVGGADMSILGDLVSQLGANRREDESLKVAKDKIDKDKDTQDQIIALKRDELGLEERRTGAYEKDVQARFNNLMREYEEAKKGGYGRGSTFYKRLFGEVKGTLSDYADGLSDKDFDEYLPFLLKASPDSIADEFGVSPDYARRMQRFLRKLNGDANSVPAKKTGDTSDDWDAYLKYKLSAEKNGVKNYTYDMWRSAGKPR